MIEIAREAFAFHGHEVNFEFLPWSRALRQAQSGEIDGEGFVEYGLSPANPKSAEYVIQLNDGIARLRASGRLDEIMASFTASPLARTMRNDVLSDRPKCHG